jgi:hypothetical protein
MPRRFRSVSCVPGLALLAGVVVLALGQAATPTDPGYGRVPEGAFSVVAEVRAKPGKEAELRAITLPYFR